MNSLDANGLLPQSSFERKRAQLVEYLKSTHALVSKDIEEAFARVPRELFLPFSLRTQAYEDEAIPLLASQTVSQPSTLATMLEALQVKKEMNVLEVGSGSGYVCALLAELVGPKGRVTGMELLPALAETAQSNLRQTPYTNIQTVQGDGTLGFEPNTPYDRVLVSAAAPFVPKPLFSQLKEGGRIVAPVGEKFVQTLQIVEKKNGKLLKKDVHPFTYQFVPLKGKHGWNEQ
ncbi:MAG: protein-L-isoaspartate(D-aspartate) O-methyltransferase [Candidatus Diapherotrites archaeon]|nr:protein-L-isoaspartate(D-aspartate) O-methyltransferase [Candidatus Diapherotrites archaeon]